MSCMEVFLVADTCYELVKIYAPSLPNPYDLIICYHAELVSVKLHMKLKPEIQAEKKI